MQRTLILFNKAFSHFTSVLHIFFLKVSARGLSFLVTETRLQALTILEISKMRSFILLSLIPLLSTVTAAPQVVPVIGGLLGDAGLTPITGALGDVLNSIPILYAAAPSFLMTKDPSPQCAAVNHGMYSPSISSL